MRIIFFIKILIVLFFIAVSESGCYSDKDVKRTKDGVYLILSDSVKSVDIGEVENWTLEIVKQWEKFNWFEEVVQKAVSRVIVETYELEKFTLGEKEYRSFVYPYSTEVSVAILPSPKSLYFSNANPIDIFKSCFYHEVSIILMGEVGGLWENTKIIYDNLEAVGW